jgi:molybdopterin-guanine dinucleotide biosynthesis protein A
LSDENSKNGLVQGYVLAGGGSTRFGGDKALAIFDGTPMLLRMQTLLRSVVNDVLVIAPPHRYAPVGISGVADRWEGQGPLAGIMTALLTTKESFSGAEWNLIVGCDMPFLTQEWLGYLLERASDSEAEAIAPRSLQGLEPLCACWRTSVAAKLQKTFDVGTRKITEAMKAVDMEVVDETDWKQFDAAGRLFWNMNTIADYNEAKRILEAQRA